MKRKTKTKKYDPQYLAIILAVVLLAEGSLFSVSTSADWKAAASILDVSDAVVQTAHDTASLFQPEIEMVSSINTFYELGAAQMAQLLSFSYENMSASLAFTVDGIAAFYQESSVQMAQLLGLPNSMQRPAVAGISITK